MYVHHHALSGDQSAFRVLLLTVEGLGQFSGAVGKGRLKQLIVWRHTLHYSRTVRWTGLIRYHRGTSIQIQTCAAKLLRQALPY